jgi:LysM repeat protein
MKVLMHRIVVLGGLGLLLSMVGTACTLAGAGAAPLTMEPGGIVPLATPTDIGLLPAPTFEGPSDATATVSYDPFAATPVFETPADFEPSGLETPSMPGVDATPDLFATPTPIAPVATVTPLSDTVPTVAPATPVFSTDDECPPTYTVQAGDNLFRIALRFGLTYQELASANGIINPDALPVGTVLKIPGCGGTAAPSSDSGVSTSGGGTVQPLPGDTVDANGDILHTVKSGENLFRIALSYGLSWERVAAYNGITNPNNISVGQVIRIPRS